jgi:hypothetical protein
VAYSIDLHSSKGFKITQERVSIKKDDFTLFVETLSNERSRRFVLSLLSDLLKRRTARDAIANMLALLITKKGL